MEKLFQMMDNVKELLTNWTSIRDNDEKLMANIWGMFIGEKDLDNMSGRDLLSALSHGTLPSYESISRCRRKLQEEYPYLRGNQWHQRHKRARTIKKEMPSYQCFGDETI